MVVGFYPVTVHHTAVPRRLFWTSLSSPVPSQAPGTATQDLLDANYTKTRLSREVVRSGLSSIKYITETYFITSWANSVTQQLLTVFIKNWSNKKRFWAFLPMLSQLLLIHRRVLINILIHFFQINPTGAYSTLMHSIAYFVSLILPKMRRKCRYSSTLFGCRRWQSHRGVPLW